MVSIEPVVVFGGGFRRGRFLYKDHDGSLGGALRQ